MRRRSERDAPARRKRHYWVPSSTPILNSPSFYAEFMQVVLSTRKLAVIGVIVIVVAVTAGIFHDQSIKGVYNSLNPVIYSDKNQLSDQYTTISTLRDTVSTQDGQISQLRNQISHLQGQLTQSQTAKMKGDFSYHSDSGCGHSSNCLYYVNGAYANVGSNSANHAKITFTFFSQSGLTGQVLCNVDDILGSVSGGSVHVLPTPVICQSSSTVQAHSFSYQFSYS